MACNIALLPSDVIDFMIFFFHCKLSTCDPKVTNVSTHERVSGTFQKSFYRHGKNGGGGGVGAKGWSVKFRLCMGDFL